MAEVAGLVVGAVALASLFTTCVDCVDLVEAAGNSARDFEILQTKYEAQKLRLMIWGEASGIVGQLPYDINLDLPTVRPVVARSLNCIQLLFEDGNQLAHKYGLKRSSSENNGQLRLFNESYQRFRTRLNRTQSDAGFVTRTGWAIKNKTKFSLLVTDLKDLVDAIMDITQSGKLLRTQRDLIDAEIESVGDIRTLGTIVEATAGTADAISDSASLRLLSLGERSALNSALTSSHHAYSSSSAASTYYTAPQPPSIASPLSDGIDSEEIDRMSRRLDAIYLDDQTQGQRLMSRVIAETHVTPTQPTQSQYDTPARPRFNPLRLSAASLTRVTSAPIAEAHWAKRVRKDILRVNQDAATARAFIGLIPIEDNLDDLLGSLSGPPNTAYAGGTFFVRLHIQADFPFKPPIYPNVEDPLVPEVAEQYVRDRSRFDEITRDYTIKYAMTGSPKLTTHGPPWWENMRIDPPQRPPQRPPQQPSHQTDNISTSLSYTGI